MIGVRHSGHSDRPGYPVRASLAFVLAVVSTRYSNAGFSFQPFLWSIFPSGTHASGRSFLERSIGLPFATASPVLKFNYSALPKASSVVKRGPMIRIKADKIESLRFMVLQLV